MSPACIFSCKSSNLGPDHSNRPKCVRLSEASWSAGHDEQVCFFWPGSTLFTLFTLSRIVMERNYDAQIEDAFRWSFNFHLWCYFCEGVLIEKERAQFQDQMLKCYLRWADNFQWTKLIFLGSEPRWELEGRGDRGAAGRGRLGGGRLHLLHGLLCNQESDVKIYFKNTYMKTSRLPVS